ncbi:unnamed protein product [Parascedosporium putredinis]|uniref:CBM21 domain-containing protein n=1 Tax=Parascedosporium putredinis TaxID=1442378 RepID=A0A9P1H9L6_9PEZI|nr:unnamed protein product [Parascedosporium putredinis]CAI8001086.1 unnamed protein product [Parascedosporium putredinis]
MRGRKLPNLKALKDAVNSIPLRRESSPVNQRAPVVKVVEQLLSQPVSFVEEDSEDEKRTKPPMVRKKSGELVRPALRLSSHRRPSSMPGTPTFSKAVHFDSHLEHVRHFLQVDRPLAVSAGSSPVDHLESDSEYPFPRPTRNGLAKYEPPYEWEIITSNFPADDLARNALPARVERLWLSKDCRSLHGSVVVANLAFHKSLTCRFTLDYWKTTSEVAAEYASQIHSTGHDRWSFSIRLSDMANLETKTLYLCVRYNVNGQEYWDNNDGANFQVDFHKKYLPQNGKGGFQGAGSRSTSDLPRSSRRSNPNTNPRPKSMPVGLSSHLIDQARRTLDKSRDEFLDDNGPIRLKRSTSDSRDATSSSRTSNAFGQRYDFNASLNEAKQSARSKESKKIPTPTPTVSTGPARSLAAPVENQDSPKKKDYTYDEIVNRFCFYGSKQGQTTGQAQTAQPSVKPPPPSGGLVTVTEIATRSYQLAPTTKDASDSSHRAPSNGPNFTLSSSPRPDLRGNDGSAQPSLRAGSPMSHFSPRAAIHG